MKNKKTKMIKGLTLSLVLSFAFLPISSDAATTTPSIRSKIQARPTLTATDNGTSTLRSKGLRAASVASSTKNVKEVKLAKNIEDAITKADKEITKRSML